MLKKILMFIGLLSLIVAAGIWWMLQPVNARFSTAELSGRVPVLSAPRPQSLPSVTIADRVGWSATGAPRAPAGFAVTRFAAGLDHPRMLHVLPNGDVLVAETNGPARTPDGMVDRIEQSVMARAGAGVPSANRITLLRDTDGDGVAEVRTRFLTGLNSPYGMALVGDTFFVANTDGLMAFPYTPGATSIAAAGRRIAPIAANAPNRHWARSLVVGADGMLYVGVGSNSNIGENSIASERGRAMVVQVNPTNGARRIVAVGLRNPSGLAIEPGSGQLWAAVNERDALGPDMVPDYMSRVDFGDFYGWPWYYWGGFVDDRVEEADGDDRRQYVRRPDYALGAHVAPLGMSFVTSPALGAPFTNGAFVALHGSWNRNPPAGYKVVFVAFGANGRPLDAVPIAMLSGFINAEGQAMGRPADARQAKDGALLVADDAGNIVWRVARQAAAQ
jgi:glucose/arabinose dehydrogenase